MQWLSYGARVGAVPLLVLVLGACGFHPMVGAQSNQPAVAEQLAQVEIDTIPDRAGQQLRNQLIDRFYRDGRPAKALYRLGLKIESSQMQMAVTQGVSASRSEWIVTATYQLIYLPTGEVVASGSSRAVPGFNVTYTQYASFVSENAAYDRAITTISDDISTRLSLYFARDPDQRMKLAPPDWAKPAPLPNPVTVPTPESVIHPSVTPATTGKW